MTLRRLGLLTLIWLAFASIAHAGIIDGLAFTLGCGGFTSEGGTLILDRNNTGSHREAFVISATDGDGNTIFTRIVDTGLVGTRMTIDAGTFFAWTSAPTSNPLTLTIVSQAGNGLDEQVVYEVQGSCPSLSTAIGEVSVLPTDGVSSPAVPLNGVAPRPTNSFDVVAAQPGYALVNTDNLTIRSGDGVEYRPVAIVDGGTPLIVLGRNLDASWWFVQVGDFRGWVTAELIILRGDLTDVPVVRAVGELIPATFFVFVNRPIFEKPGSSRALCTIKGEPDGLEYRVVGRTRTSSYFQIQAICSKQVVAGWIAADDGTLNNPAERPIPVTG